MPKVPAKLAEKQAPQPPGKAAQRPPAKPVAQVGGPPHDPLAQRGGTLTVAIRSDISNANPFTNISSVGKKVKETIWESLLTWDLQGRLHPGLAESWQVGDDAQSFTFNLRRGVRFHDGREMTADDVLWSLDYAMNPENAATGYSRLASVAGAEKVDDYTLRLTTHEPHVTLLSHLAEIRGFSVVPAGSMQPGELEVGRNPPPGTGPFKFVEYVPNVRTVVARNDEYWGGAPYLDRVVFELIHDMTLAFTALRAGDVGVIEMAPVEWLPNLKAGEVPEIEIHLTPDSGTRRIQFNQTSPLLSNQTLREAVAYAIDRDVILGEAFEGLGTPLNAKVPVGSLWHTVAIPPRERDLDRSRELQRQAGYEGEEIVVTAQRGRERFTEPIERMLSEAGFNVNVEILESAVREERRARGQFDLSIGGGSVHPDPSVSLRADYYCEHGMELRTDNETGYCNPEIDDILDQLDQTADEAQRLELFERFAEITWNDVVNIYIAAEPRYQAWHDTVQSFVPTDGGDWINPETGGLARTWLRR